MEEQKLLENTIVYKGIAVGKIFNHVVNEETNNYTNRVLKKIVKKIEEIIRDEEKQLNLTLSRFKNSKPQIVISSHFISNFYSCLEFKQLLNKKLFIERKGVALSLSETYEEYNITHKEEYLPYFKKEIKKIFEKERLSFFKRLLVRTKKDLLYHKINSLKENTILCLDEFEVEYLDQIPKAIKGIITSNDVSSSLKVKHYLGTYNLPLIFSKQKIKNGCTAFIDTKNHTLKFDWNLDYYKSYKIIAENGHANLDDKPLYTLGKRRINVFLNITDARFKKEVSNKGWFNQIGVINTEILYGVKGSVMHKEEMCYRLTQILKGLPFSEAIFQIPDFSPTKSCSLNGDNEYTDLFMLEEFEEVFLEAIRGIAMASKKLENTKVLLPMLINSDEIDHWRDLIEDVFLEYTKKVPEIGVVVETDALIDRGEELEEKGVSFSILDLDDLSEELIENHFRFNNLKYKDYIDILKTETQQYHQSLRSIKLEHGISGHALENTKIFKRIITQGYLNLYLSLHQIKIVAHEISAYIENEGKFVNNDQRIEKIKRAHQKKQEELTLAIKTEKHKRSRIYNTKAAKPRKRKKINY